MRLGEVAKIAGVSPDAQDTDSLAYLVHMAALSRARRQGNRVAPMPGGHEEGFIMTGTLAEVIMSLWPDTRNDEGNLDSAWSKPVYSHLKAAGNAVHMTDKTWWLRKKYQRQAVVVHHHTAMTARERRLTPVEAGEDREPGKVTVRRMPKTKELIHGDPKDLIISVLLEYDRPLSAADFNKIRETKRHPAHSVPSSVTVYAHVDELVELGMIIKRDNPHGVQPKYLIAHADYTGDDWVFKKTGKAPALPRKKSTPTPAAIEEVAPKPAPEPVPAPEPPAPEPPAAPAASADSDVAARIQRLIEQRVEEATREIRAERDALAAKLAAIEGALGGII